MHVRVSCRRRRLPPHRGAPWFDRPVHRQRSVPVPYSSPYVRSRKGRSPFQAADAVFLRSMLDIVGDLLAQMATETDSVAILQGLCGSLRSFVDADRVSPIVDADADQSVLVGRSSPTEMTTFQRPSRPIPAPSVTAQAASPSRSCHPRVSRWPRSRRTGRPVPSADQLDRQVTGRFANLAFVVIERHLAHVGSSNPSPSTGR